jgi:hypothetical protein
MSSEVGSRCLQSLVLLDAVGGVDGPVVPREVQAVTPGRLVLNAGHLHPDVMVSLSYPKQVKQSYHAPISQFSLD